MQHHNFDKTLFFQDMKNLGIHYAILKWVPDNNLHWEVKFSYEEDYILYKLAGLYKDNRFLRLVVG